MSNVIELAKAKAQADKEYGEAFRAHLRVFKPLDDEEFWPILELFQGNVVSRLKYGNGVKEGAHNLLCELVYHRTGEDRMDAWENMARFLARYEQNTRRLSAKMNDMPNLDRGDDSYGDLLDSLPLAGKEIFDAIMGDDIANNKQLEKAFIDHPLGKVILHGENYVCMTFEKVLLKSFVSVSRDHEEDREEALIPHVALVVEPVKADRPWGDVEGLKTMVRGPFRNGNEAAQFAEQNPGAQIVRLFEGLVKR